VCVCVCVILLLLSFDRGDTSEKKLLFILSWHVLVWAEEHINLAFRTECTVDPICCNPAEGF